MIIYTTSKKTGEAAKNSKKSLPLVFSGKMQVFPNSGYKNVNPQFN